MHTVIPGWESALDKPKAFTVANSLHCHHCGALLAFTLKAQCYGVSGGIQAIMAETEKCEKRPAEKART